MKDKGKNVFSQKINRGHFRFGSAKIKKLLFCPVNILRLLLVQRLIRHYWADKT